MSYRVRFTTPSGATGYWEGTFATRTGATHSAQSRADITGYTYAVEEAPDASTAAVPDPSPDPTASQSPWQPGPSKPSIGVMPRRVWEKQRIRALAKAIVRRMGHEEPMVASVFDLAHVQDWAAEIVELCERHDGQQAKPSEAEAIRRLEADNRDLHERLAVAQRQRDEAVGRAAGNITENIQRHIDANNSVRMATLQRFFSGNRIMRSEGVVRPRIHAIEYSTMEEFAYGPNIYDLADALANVLPKEEAKP